MRCFCAEHRLRTDDDLQFGGDWRGLKDLDVDAYGVALKDAVCGREVFNPVHHADVIAGEQHAGIAVDAGDVGKVDGEAQMGFAPGIA